MNPFGGIPYSSSQFDLNQIIIVRDSGINVPVNGKHIYLIWSIFKAMDLNIIYKKYGNRGTCISLIERIMWVNFPKCPYCESPKYATLKNEYRYHCATCNCSYSVTVGTIFHNSKLDLQKWFLLICILLEANFNISSRELAKKVSINKDTACRVKRVIREAMYDSEQRKLILKINNKLNNKIYD